MVFNMRRPNSINPSKENKPHADVLAEKHLTFEVLHTALFLIILQIADTVYTLLGVSRHGLGMEGNVLLRNLMEHYGAFQGLIMVKALALLMVFCLAHIALTNTWVKNAMYAICVIYLFAAIFPWAYILSSAA